MYIVLLFAFTLYHIPYLLTDGEPSFLLRIIFISPIFFYALSTIVNKYNSETIFLQWNSDNKIFIMYISLMFIALFRSYFLGEIRIPETMFFLFLWSSIILFAISIVLHIHQSDYPKLLHYFFASLGVYVTINVVFHFLGITSSAKRLFAMYTKGTSEALMLSSLGIKTDRVLFLMTTGLNEFGLICGSVIVIWSLIFFNSTNSAKLKFVSVLFLFFALCGILLTDSRAAVLFLLFTVLFFALVKHYWKIIAFAFFLLPVVIPLFLFNIDVISEHAMEYNVTSVARNPDEVKQLAGRYIVWDNAFKFLSEFSLTHVVGYGLFSQAISGLSIEYYSLGKLFQNPDRVTLHNSYLQYLLDVGYIGMLVFLLAYYSVLKKLNRLRKCNSNIIYTIAIAFLFFMGLTSLFEISLTLYNISTAFIVLFMMTITLFYRDGIIKSV